MINHLILVTAANKQNKLVDAALLVLTPLKKWVPEQNYWISKVFDVLFEFNKSVMNIFSNRESFKRAQGLGITFVEYTICVLLDLWGAFLQEKYPRVRLLLENLTFNAFIFFSVCILTATDSSHCQNLVKTYI